ncbi:uncharacterized protein C3orf38 homolog [Dendronephthya gigantea]|uniref:uncharacterized protein C3orf38 homolog n=1 Tax=Dendronephthya gigantea TaxID=151771 RepID=UPI00106A06D9|nr:uncharacterized protein C3orf38 homolog [Dendronephthya gigantea]
MDDFEKKECLQILDLLTLDNLLSLTDTVTNRVVSAENKEEALSAIMLYTRSSEELLRRRKVRRENLYEYLAKQGHIEHPAADKNTLLRKVLKFWELKKQGKDVKELGDTGFILAQPGDRVTVGYTDPETQPENSDENGPTMTVIKREDTSPINITSEDNSSLTPEEKSSEASESQDLAIHFSSWFYKLLNSLSSTPGTIPTDWGPQHFWQDAKLMVQCNEPSGLQETTVDSANLVSEKFLSMVVVDRLCFNPNLSNDSIKGKRDSHGLVVVMVGGTVHRGKEYLGVFEQSFGLIRDPTEENNWKIKFSKLMLKASGSCPNNRLESPVNQVQGTP